VLAVCLLLFAGGKGQARPAKVMLALFIERGVAEGILEDFYQTL